MADKKPNRKGSIEGQLSLFPEFEVAAPAASGAGPGAAARAQTWPAWPPGLWVGTSSWSFPGWKGLVYDGQYSESRLSREGLRAYSRHPLLGAVGLDRTYYAPISVDEYRRYADQVPDDFRFLVKAPERLCLPRFPRHPRYASLAGESNPDFLSQQMALQDWVEPAMQGLGSKLGCLLLQFPPLSPAAVGGAAGFAVALHGFLEGVDRGATVAVEIRNRELFGSAYLSVLQRLGACHCLTVHPKMPTLAQQAQHLGPQPLTVIRWMLSLPDYEAAVERYQPFDRLIDEDLATRQAIVQIWRDSLAQQRPVMTIVNNKAEGCSPLSIERLAEEWWGPPVPF